MVIKVYVSSISGNMEVIYIEFLQLKILLLLLLKKGKRQSTACSIRIIRPSY